MSEKRSLDARGRWEKAKKSEKSELLQGRFRASASLCRVAERHWRPDRSLSGNRNRSKIPRQRGGATDDVKRGEANFFCLSSFVVDQSGGGGCRWKGIPTSHSRARSMPFLKRGNKGELVACASQAGEGQRRADRAVRLREPPPNQGRRASIFAIALFVSSPPLSLSLKAAMEEAATPFLSHASLRFESRTCV